MGKRILWALLALGALALIGREVPAMRRELKILRM
jgi:hypothetical protein